MSTPALPTFCRKLLFAGLGLAAFLLLSSCTKAPPPLPPLEEAMLAAAKRHPQYSAKWDGVIRDLTHGYLEGLHTGRWDKDRGRIARESIENGCRDPFVRYLWFRQQGMFTDRADEARAREGFAIVSEMHAASYPAFIRAYAGNRLYFVWKPFFGKAEAEATKQIYLQYWRDALEAIQDDLTPEWLASGVARDIQIMWNHDQASLKDLRNRIDAILTVRFGECATMHYLHGRQSTDRIYRQLNGYVAAKDQDADLTQEIESARKSFLRAWELDPTDQHIAAGMIDVCRYLKLPPAEMEQWYQRALATGRDCSRPDAAKLLYLAPEWHGSFEQQLAFARECQAHPERSWQSPLLLAQVYDDHRKNEGLPASYIAQPEVWADIHRTYTAYLRDYPDAMSERLAYAHLAWLAGQWKILEEQLVHLDPALLYLSAIGGEATFAQMETDAEAHRETPSKPDARKGF